MSPSFSPQDIAAAIGGKLVAGSLPEAIKGVSINSRTLQPGDLFVALRGDRFDGHDFVPSALDQGAIGAIVSRWPLKGVHPPPNKAIWQVRDTFSAFGELARFHREHFSFPLIAITGSSGKTSTKEMLKHILSKSWKVLATRGTQNNLVGVPLTLLELTAAHQAAVVELGTNRWGEIRRLAQWIRPTVGVLTNIGPSHLETFGDCRWVLREKQALWEVMDPQNPIVLNADDPLLWEAGQKLSRPVIWFSTKGGFAFGGGTSPIIHVWATSIKLESWGSECLVNDQWKLTLPVPGTHNLMNALAACSAAQAVGIELPAALESLWDVASLSGRLGRTEAAGCTILDDTYNANPLSFKAALEVFKGLPCSARRILVMGDMLELGYQSEMLHQEAGRSITGNGINFLVTVGPLTQHFLEAARKAGFPENASWGFLKVEEVGEFLIGLIRCGDLILLKGSRGMHMERILDRLCSTPSSLR